MNHKRTRYSCAPPEVSPVRQVFVPVAMMLLLLNFSSAQNLIVNGTVNNTGKIRVKNQTVITQPVVGGEIELKGADQILPAKQYQYVRLSGTGTKTTSGGDLSIQKNLTIAAAVTLQIPKGNIVTLGDTLFESGFVNGAIQKSVDLTGSTTSSNFGNIGATITWSSIAPGITNVIRASDSVQTGNGNQSVKRYYQIQPTDATATGTVVFKYSDNELNGHDVNHLQLWRSTDNGLNWQRHIPVVDTLLKTLSKTNVQLSGRWAMADTVRALGPLQSASGVPAIIAAASTHPSEQVILSTLDTVKVLISDIFGTPVKNVAVKFSISSRPTPASGGLLTDTSSVTNSSGIASTVFTLGSKVGAYEVVATAANLDTVRIKTIARHGSAQAMAPVAITQQVKQILTPLDTAFTITVADIGGNPVDSAQVQFSIIDIPFGSFGEGLSTISTITDSNGRASTLLTLGSKIAPYTVRAKVIGISDSANIHCTSNGWKSGTVDRTAGEGQSAINGSPLPDPFVVSVLDLGGNPVPGDTVEFKLQANAFGAVLSKTIVATDNLGQASTVLTLGTRTGIYTVSAQSKSLSGSLQFGATALAGGASSLAEIQGSNQTTTINATLSSDFVVRVLDMNGNNVPNAPVTFTIDSVPNPLSIGQSLSITSDTTDTSGLASTRLTVGNKSGIYVVNARVNNVPVLSFKATAQPGAATAIADVSGNNQTTQIVTPLTNEFAVRIIDAGGNNVPGTTVSFTVDSIPLNATAFNYVIRLSFQIPTDLPVHASLPETRLVRIG